MVGKINIIFLSLTIIIVGVSLIIDRMFVSSKELIKEIYVPYSKSKFKLYKSNSGATSSTATVLCEKSIYKDKRRSFIYTTSEVQYFYLLRDSILVIEFKDNTKKYYYVIPK